MKKLLISLVAVITICACNTPVKEDSASSKQVLRHVVLFEWADSITDDKRDELIEHFASLKDKIDVIKDFEYGSDVSVEGLAKGYSHCFIVTFEDEAARDIYLPHPDHKVFGDSVVPYLKNVLVVDYISNN